MFDVTILPNGLQIVMETIPFIRSITFGIWVRNGSRNETKATGGISHFIEHMLFKGTEKRTAMDIADEMDAIGGQVNAYTAKEYTCYYTRTLDTHFDLALDILADMFFHARFAEGDIRKECNVILEEINMYEDTPEELVHDLLQSRVWPQDPLGHPVLGTKESISSFDTHTFKQYFSEHYCPENTVLALAGNFTKEEALAKIEAYFGHFRRETPYRAPQFCADYKPGLITKEKDIEQIHLCMGFPSISIGSEEAYVLACLNTLFGGGMSSRLFQTIREEHALAYSVYSYNASYTDGGLFSIYAGLNPAQAEEVFHLIVREINRFFTERITAEQLEKAKEQLKSNYLLSLESSSNRMNSIGRSQLMLGKMISPDELIEKIDAVDTERMYDLAGRVFRLDQMSLSAVGDIRGVDFEGLMRHV